MEYDYGRLSSISEDEFKEKLATCSVNLADSTLSDKEDIAKIERLLDIKAGTLEKQEFRLGKRDCECCNRRLTFYDFIYTAIVDAGHSKSFVVHTLIGSKFIINKPRTIRCSGCNTTTLVPEYYECSNYGCCSG